MTHIATVTIDHTKVAGDLTDFPVLIDLSDLPSSAWSSITSDGGNLRCHTQGKAKQLPREVYGVNTSTKKGIVHVLFGGPDAPGVLSSSTDTIIEIHVDGVSAEPAVTDPYGRNAVWADYDAVYHLENTVTIVDSSGNQVDGSGDGGAFVSGQINDAVEFDATGADKVDLGDTLLNDYFAGGGVVSVWFKADSDGQNDFGRLLRTENGGGAVGWDLYARSESGGNISLRFTRGWTTTEGEWDTTASIGVFHYSVISYNEDSTANDPSWYLDGANASPTEVSTPAGSVVSDADGPKWVGNRPSDSAREWDGIIDEIRFRPSEPTSLANWVSTEYANQNSPATFYSTQTAFDARRQDIINLLNGSLTGVGSFDGEKDHIPVSAVVRTSDTVVTIDLSALDGNVDVSEDDIVSLDTLTAVLVQEELSTATTGSFTIADGSIATISPQVLTQLQELSTPTLAALGVLSPQVLTQLQELSTPTLAALGVLNPQVLTQLQELSTPTLAALGVLSSQALTQLQELSTPLLQRANTLAPQTLTQLQELSAPTLAALGVLSPQALTQLQELSAPTLAALGVLSPQVLTQLQELSQAGLLVPGDLSPQALTQLQELSASTLAALGVLSPAELTQLQELSAPTLAALGVLSPAELTQLQELSAPTLAALGVLSPQALNQLQELGQAGLVVPGELSPQALTQLQELSQPALQAFVVLAPTDLAQVQVLSQPTLQGLVSGELSPENLAQLQTLSQPTLEALGVLSPEALVQTQTLVEPTVLVLAVLSPTGLAQLQTLTQPVLSFRELLVTENLTQLQVVGAPNLTSSGAIAPEALIQANLLTSAVVFVPGVVGPSLLLELTAPELLRVLTTSDSLRILNPTGGAIVKGDLN